MGRKRWDWLLPLILFPGPWLVVGALVLFVRRLDGASLGTALMLAYEFLLYYVVFTSSNSTAGLEYMFKPGVQLLLLFPLGLVIGWVKGRSARKRSNSPSSEIKTSTRQ